MRTVVIIDDEMPIPLELLQCKIGEYAVMVRTIREIQEEQRQQRLEMFNQSVIPSFFPRESEAERQGIKTLDDWKHVKLTIQNGRLIYSRSKT